MLSKHVDNRVRPLAGKAVKMVGQKLITLFAGSSHARLRLAKSVSTRGDTYQSGAIKPVPTKVGTHRAGWQC